MSSNVTADLFRDAQKDPSLLSTIDIDQLLDSTKNDFLENCTFESIAKNVVESLVLIHVDKKSSQLKEYCEKLVGYRYVDELHLLHKGKYVRWIRLDDSTKQLMKGGIVVDVRFGDIGPNVVCRMTSGKFLQYRFNQCLTYQKLTDEEQLILSVL